MKSKNLFWWVLCVSVPLFTLFWQGCDKEPTNFLGSHTILKGRIVENGTLKPIPNAIVRIRTCEGEILGNISCTTVLRDTTDTNGYYYFDFIHNKVGLYELLADAKNCYTGEGDVIKGYETEQDIDLQTLGWVKVHVKNITPYDENDTMSISGVHIYIDGRIKDPFFKGKDIDTIFVGEILGNNVLAMTTYNSRNNKGIYIRDSVYSRAFDTTYFEIKY